MVQVISIRKLKVCHTTGDLRYEVLGVEIKVMEQSHMSLNILFPLISSKDILHLHV